MDKYLEVLCKQNPVKIMGCGNPECKGKFEVKTKEFFKNESYSHVCEDCGKSTTYDTSKVAEKLKSQLKKLGITLG